MILVGDIGGTHSRLALFTPDGPSLVKDAVYSSRKFSGLAEVIREFLGATQPPLELEKACFGVAGPVKNGHCKLTHLPWDVDVKSLRSLLSIEAVCLINDLVALAAAVPFLKPSEVRVLQAGVPDPQGKIAVIAAGTGLGQSFLIPQERGLGIVVATEGGQCDFPPHQSEAIALHRFLTERAGRVALEDVLSGPGLVRIYEFFKSSDAGLEPQWLTGELLGEDPAAVISQCGLARKNSNCEKALDLFVSIYGAAAGNLALQLGAGGGIYLAGGIAPKIISRLKTSQFLDSFRAKGAFKNFMMKVPVKVILNDRAALFGAAHYAISGR